MVLRRGAATEEVKLQSEAHINVSLDLVLLRAEILHRQSQPLRRSAQHGDHALREVRRRGRRLGGDDRAIRGDDGTVGERAADIDGELAQLRELAPEIDPPALDDAISHDLYGRVLAELATGSGNGAGVSGDAPDPPDASAEAEPLPANAETGRATGEGSEPPPDNPFGWLLSLGFGVMVIGFLAAIETTPVRLLPIDDRAIRAPGGETERPVELVPDEFLPGAEVIVEDLD